MKKFKIDINKIFVVFLLFFVIVSSVCNSYALGSELVVKGNDKYPFEEFRIHLSDEFEGLNHGAIFLHDYAVEKEGSWVWGYAIIFILSFNDFSYEVVNNSMVDFHFTDCYVIDVNSSLNGNNFFINYNEAFTFLQNHTFVLSDFTHRDSRDTCFGSNQIFSSSKDVDFGNGSVFQGTPLGVVLMGETQAEEVLSKAVEITKMIIPISLAIFGTLLIVYLLRYKIFSKVV